MSTSDRSGDTRATAASRSERGVHLEREGPLENAITKIREDRASSPAETNPARGPLSPLPSASLPRIEGVGRSQGSKRRNATKVISINIEAHALSKSGMDPPRSHPRDDPSLARSALFECRARELFAKQLFSLSLGFGVLPEKVLPDYREANNEVTSWTNSIFPRFAIARGQSFRKAFLRSRGRMLTHVRLSSCAYVLTSVLVLLDTFNTCNLKQNNLQRKQREVITMYNDRVSRRKEN